MDQRTMPSCATRCLCLELTQIIYVHSMFIPSSLLMMGLDAQSIAIYFKSFGVWPKTFAEGACSRAWRSYFWGYTSTKGKWIQTRWGLPCGGLSKVIEVCHCIKRETVWIQMPCFCNIRRTRCSQHFAQKEGKQQSDASCPTTAFSRDPAWFCKAVLFLCWGVKDVG